MEKTLKQIRKNLDKADIKRANGMNDTKECSIAFELLMQQDTERNNATPVTGSEPEIRQTLISILEQKMDINEKTGQYMDEHPHYRQLDMVSRKQSDHLCDTYMQTEHALTAHICSYTKDGREAAPEWYVSSKIEESLSGASSYFTRYRIMNDLLSQMIQETRAGHKDSVTFLFSKYMFYELENIHRISVWQKS